MWPISCKLSAVVESLLRSMCHYIEIHTPYLQGVLSIIVSLDVFTDRFQYMLIEPVFCVTVHPVEGPQGHSPAFQCSPGDLKMTCSGRTCRL
jgi:hypothetical protein